MSSPLKENKKDNAHEIASATRASKDGARAGLKIMETTLSQTLFVLPKTQKPRLSIDTANVVSTVKSSNPPKGQRPVAPILSAEEEVALAENRYPELIKEKIRKRLHVADSDEVAKSVKKLRLGIISPTKSRRSKGAKCRAKDHSS